MAGAHALHVGMSAHLSLKNETTLHVAISRVNGLLHTGKLTAPLALQIGDEVMLKEALDDGEVVDDASARAPKTGVTQVNEDGTFDIKDGALGAQVQAGVKRDDLVLVAATRTDIKGYTIKISGDTVEGMHLGALAVDFANLFNHLRDADDLPETIGGPALSTREFQKQVINLLALPGMDATVINIFGTKGLEGKDKLCTWIMQHWLCVLVNSEKDFKDINPLMMRRDEHDRAGTDPAIHGIMVTLDRTDERLLNPKKKEALFQMFEKLMNGRFPASGKFPAVNAWPDGKVPWILVSSNEPLKPSGNAKMTPERLRTYKIEYREDGEPLGLTYMPSGCGVGADAAKLNIEKDAIYKMSIQQPDTPEEVLWCKYLYLNTGETTVMNATTITDELLTKNVDLFKMYKKNGNTNREAFIPFFTKATGLELSDTHRCTFKVHRPPKKPTTEGAGGSKDPITPAKRKAPDAGSMPATPESS